MTTSRAGPGWRRLLAPGIATVVTATLLVGLGLWQLERKAWKEELIGTLTQRLSATPAPLPAREQWSRLDARAEEFRRVTFPAEFLYERQAFVYAPGAGVAGDASGPGYFVFTPARLAGGSLVVVNRGFIPQARKDEADKNQPGGLAEIVGILRWPQPRNAFTPEDDASRNLWFVRDPQAMAEAKGWGPVSPFFVDLESPAPANALPRPTPPSVALPNNHLNYALTWFSLAGALAIIFALWARKQLREARLSTLPSASL